MFGFDEAYDKYKRTHSVYVNSVQATILKISIDVPIIYNNQYIK